MWRSASAFRVALIVPLLLAPALSDGQEKTKVPRVGILTPAFAGHPGLDALRQELRDLGYVDGRNIVIEYRSAAGNNDRLPALTTDLVRLKVDVIVADGDQAASEAQRATKTIPIVITTGDPVWSRLVDSAARPGGNSTGVSIVPGGLHLKRFELLKDAVPSVTRVAYLCHGYEEKWDTRDLQEAERAARSLGMQLIQFRVDDPYPFEHAFAAMAKARVDALVTMPSPVFVSRIRNIVALTTQMRLPAVFFEREFAEAGGLMAYGPNVPAVFRRAAAQVDKILRGAKPADLPVEYPRDFDLAINLKSANALRLTIPKAVLSRATEVFQ